MKESNAQHVLHSIKASVIRPLGITALTCAGVLLAAACRQAASAGPAPTSPPLAAAPANPTSPDKSGTFVVTLTDANQFQPANLSIPKGATVTWKNSGQMEHTVTDDPSKPLKKDDAVLPNGASAWDSGMIRGGQTYSHTFDVPGTYKYFCIPHEALGMVGTITVTP